MFPENDRKSQYVIPQRGITNQNTFTTQRQMIPGFIWYSTLRGHMRIGGLNKVVL